MAERTKRTALDLPDCDIHPAQVSATGESRRGRISVRRVWIATWILQPGNSSWRWREWAGSLQARWTCWIGGIWGRLPLLLPPPPLSSSLLLSPYIRFIFGTYSWGESKVAVSRSAALFKTATPMASSSTINPSRENEHVCTTPLNLVCGFIST